MSLVVAAGAVVGLSRTHNGTWTIMDAFGTTKRMLSEHGELACAVVVAIMVWVAFHTVVADQAAKDGQRRADLADRCGRVGATARNDGTLDTCVRPDGVLVSAPSTR